MIRVACIVGLAVIVAAVPSSCARRRAAAPPAPPAWASPVMRGADRGLELWWWVVTDPREKPASPDPKGDKPAEERPPAPPPVFTVTEPSRRLEEVLARYLDRPIPIDDATRDLWKVHGLRLVSVPLRDLERVQSSLRLTGTVHRQWFGEITRWTDIVRGPEFDQTRLILVGDKPEEVRPGRIRLLARCWISPEAPGADTPSSRAAAGPGAALRLELVPQYEPSVSERPRFQLLTAAAGEELPGAYPHLMARADFRSAGTIRTPGAPTADDVDALVIVSDAPEADWRRPPRPREDPEEDTVHFEPLQTLGEAMLSMPQVKSASGLAPRSRAVIILIPRIPERFELLAR
ncbi:MAG: hypothetical protein KF678_11440 [Phycisphaeraceae bacterium]|nr:hypothetical protein [Phycisphaeraceae bacterium]